jgi:hypothetical protein
MAIVICPADGTITPTKNRLLCNTRVIDWAKKYFSDLTFKQSDVIMK